MTQGLVDREVLLLGNGENGWCNVLRFYPVDPWGVPKFGDLSIPNADGDGVIEHVDIGTITWLPPNPPKLAPDPSIRTMAIDAAKL